MARKEYPGVGKFKQSNTSIAGLPSIMMDSEDLYKGQKSNNKIVFLQMKKDTITMIFFSRTEVGREDIEKVVKSITK